MKAIILTFLGSIVVVAACSTDKSTSGKIQGEYDDSLYIQVQPLAIGYVDSLSVFARAAYGYRSWDGSRVSSVADDSASVTFDSSTFWWVIYAQSDTQGRSAELRDSVRFEEGTGFQRLPDSISTTGIDYRASTLLSSFSDTSSAAGLFVRGFHITGIQSPQIHFNGLDRATVLFRVRQNSLNLAYDGSLANVVYNRADLDGTRRAHPVSGALGLALDIRTATTQDTVDVNWTINIDFFIDHYHIHFESGDYYWDWDGPYGG